MKKNLIAVAAASVLVAGSAFAQGVDTLAKIKSAGVVNFGVREASGLGYTLGGGKYVGFHTEMGERIIDDLKKQLATPALKTVSSLSPRKTAFRCCKTAPSTLSAALPPTTAPAKKMPTLP